MTLRGTHNKSSGNTSGTSNPVDSNASGAGGSLASAFGRSDGQRHGSTESTDTVRGSGGGQRAVPMRVNTANKKLAQ